MKLSDARCPLMLVLGILWGWNAGVLFYLSPRLSDVSTLECCGMWYNGQCLGPDGSAIGYWVNTTHTSTTQMKTSRQKRPRMCQLGFLWLFPTKIWFYVNCGPVRGRGLYNLWYAAGWWSVGRQGCYHGILAPDLASVSCTGPASHLLAQNQQLPLRRGLICVQTLQACVLSIRGPWLSFSVK